MKPPPFSLHRATSVDHAIELLGRLNTEDDEAKVIAGGQSLVPLMNFRLARPAHLIDLSAVEEVHVITDDADGVRLGSMVRQADVLTSAPVAAEVPLLREAVSHIGHTHIRNRGTVGGSIVHADPAAELPVAVTALDGELVVRGPGGRRSIPATEFFLGPFSTALAPNELLFEVKLFEMQPRDDGGSVEWGFEELARRDGDFAMVLAATVVWRDADDTITDARIVLGGVASVPQRATDAEQTLIGTRGLAGFAAAAATARAHCDPTGDVHASAEYRSEMVEVLVGRCLAGRRGVAEHPDHFDDEPSPVPTGAASIATVNGVDHPLDEVPDRRLLADWLRDDLGLTGTHLGCEHGVCGACTVLLDGQPVRSCLMFANQAGGYGVTTIESLGTPDDLHPLQESFREHHGLQCGFCTPGMVLTALDLLERIPNPTEDEIRAELSGNICRCTGYVKIIEAVQAAAKDTHP